MICEKCGSEMLPTGELLAGFPFMGCPKCGSDETKKKIRQHKEFLSKMEREKQNNDK